MHFVHFTSKLYNSLYVGLLILLRRIDFGDFLMVAVRSVVLANFIPTATFTTRVLLTLDSRATSIRLFDCYFLTY
jgi:hypothetical protein